MKKNKLFILVLLLSTFVFTSCDKNSDDNSSTSETAFNFGTPTFRNFSGTIISEDNTPLGNVVVKLGNRVVTTNANGQFTINNASVKENFAYLTATKSGFLNGSRTLVPHEGVNNVVIKLLTENVIATISTGVVSPVMLPNGTKVVFDGAFKNVDGSAYNGSVAVSMYHLDPHDAAVFDKMPGTLFAQNADGNMRGLQTFGMVNVELKGSNGQKLQIANGHKAIMTMPITATQVGSAKSTIPLWHFDDVKGYWVEEGFSTRVGNNYVGEVSHFSWWNNDDAYTPQILNVIAVDNFGVPLNGIRVTLTRKAGSTGDVLFDLGTTNANGTLTALVPLVEDLTFRAYLTDGTIISTQNLQGTNDPSRTVYVTLAPANRG